MQENEELRQANIQRFEKLIGEVKRPGIDHLLDAIRKSDFYTAPASTRFHGAYEGGLLQHSLNVYDCLYSKMTEGHLWPRIFEQCGYTNETCIVSALLHDICKTYFYAIDYKNQKTYDADKVNTADSKQRKQDQNGTFIWETVPVYTVNDQIPYGHGEKSVMLIERCISLTSAERFAIRWHMGAYDVAPGEISCIGAAIEKYPLCLALQEADQEASHLLEK